MTEQFFDWMWVLLFVSASSFLIAGASAFMALIWWLIADKNDGP